jgi:hypothetical protein
MLERLSAVVASVLSWLAWLGSWLAWLGSACAPLGVGDPLVERCVEVIHYRHPTLRDIDIVAVQSEPETRSVTLDFEALSEPSDAEVSSRISCDFEATDRWSLEGISVGGRALTEAEVALVNSELLLRDLSRNPERLGAGSTL